MCRSGVLRSISLSPLIFGSTMDIHAAVLTAALGRRVGCNRMIFGITRGRKPLGKELVLFDEELGQMRSSGGGQLPVGVKLRGVNRHVVGVPLDPDVIRDGLQRGGESVLVEWLVAKPVALAWGFRDA